jgi:tRNA threonylcarbamoyladenosine biosynthesis protein TsaE
MELIFTIDKIDMAARQLIDQIGAASILAFEGEMGSGKTTFIKALCLEMGVTGAVSSPTFSIINEYKTQTGQIIYHMDLYRIKEEVEAINAGVEDCLLSGNICLIEWPDKIVGLLGANTMHLSVQVVDFTTRSITTTQ